VTPREVRNLIAAVVHAWPTVPYRNDEPGPLIVTWHAILADVEYAEAEAVVIAHARQGEPFPPAPGVIARAVLDARDRQAGVDAPDVDAAWREVQDGVRSRGLAAGPPDWSHPAVAAAVSSLGWRDLCLSTNPDVTRAHFLRLYESAVRRTVDRARFDSVIGIGPAATRELSP